MANHDKVVLETNEKKNDLETLIYATKRNCGDKYPIYATKEVCDQLDAECNELENWLYDVGKNA